MVRESWISLVVSNVQLWIPIISEEYRRMNPRSLQWIPLLEGLVSLSQHFRNHSCCYENRIMAHNTPLKWKKNGEGNKARIRTTHGHYQFRLNNASQVESVLIQRALSSEIEASDTFLCGLSEPFHCTQSEHPASLKGELPEICNRTLKWEKGKRQKDIVLKSIF